MKVHRLRTHPAPFATVRSGEKRHEIRVNDRDFRKSDRVELAWFDPETGMEDGRLITATIGHVSAGGTWACPQTSACSRSWTCTSSADLDSRLPGRANSASDLAMSPNGIHYAQACIRSWTSSLDTLEIAREARDAGVDMHSSPLRQFIGLANQSPRPQFVDELLAKAGWRDPQGP